MKINYNKTQFIEDEKSVEIEDDKNFFCSFTDSSSYRGYYGIYWYMNRLYKVKLIKRMDTMIEYSTSEHRNICTSIDIGKIYSEYNNVEQIEREEYMDKLAYTVNIFNS